MLCGLQVIAMAEAMLIGEFIYQFMFKTWYKGFPDSLIGVNCDKYLHKFGETACLTSENGSVSKLD